MDLVGKAFIKTLDYEGLIDIKDIRFLNENGEIVDDESECCGMVEVLDSVFLDTVREKHPDYMFINLVPLSAITIPIVAKLEKQDSISESIDVEIGNQNFINVSEKPGNQASVRNRKWLYKQEPINESEELDDQKNVDDNYLQSISVSADDGCEKDVPRKKVEKVDVAIGKTASGEPYTISDFCKVHLTGNGIHGMIVVKMKYIDESGKTHMDAVETMRNDLSSERIKDLFLIKNRDYYFTVNTFDYKKRFETKNIRTLLNIVADIDAHDMESGEANRMAHKLAEAVLNAAGEGWIPMPNTLVFSGRGLQIIWACEPLSYKLSKERKAYENASEKIFARIREILDAPAFRDMNFDHGASARPGGLFRLPGSYNTAAKAMGTYFFVSEKKLDIKEYCDSEVEGDVFIPDKAGAQRWLVVPWDDCKHAKKLGAKWDNIIGAWYVPYGIDDTVFERWYTDQDVDALKAESEIRKKKREEKEKRRNSKWCREEGNKYLVLSSTAAKNRTRQLEELFKMRWESGNPIGKGKRDLFLLQYFCAVVRCEGESSESAMRKAIEMDTRFNNPLGENTVRTYLRSAAEKKYSYCDAEMAAMLDISKDECAILGISMTKGLWLDYTPIKAENKRLKEERNREVLLMYDSGMSVKDIAAEKKISVPTVYSILNNAGRSNSTKKKREIALEAIANGLCVKDAAAKAGVSERSIRNYMKSADS